MKTQLEIEQGYSKVAFYESMDIALEETFMQLSGTGIYNKLSKATGINDTETITDIIKQVLMIMGNPMAGVKSNYNSERMMTIQQVVSVFAQIPEIAGDDIQEVYLRAFNILEVLDGIVYDIREVNYTKLKDFELEVDEEEVQAKVFTSFEVGNSLILADIKMSHLPPMVEEPVKWTEAHNGGYLLNTSKPTLKRGHDLQPNSALQFINRMQKNKWRIVNYNPERERISIENSQILKGKSFIQAKEIADITTKSLVETYETVMESEEIYFAWKYDARGRAYDLGYDFHLQGCKNKKGMQVPIFTTPKADAILELWD